MDKNNENPLSYSENMNLGTLQKGLDILFLLKEHSLLSVPEMAKYLDLPPSSVYRYLSNLKGRGLVNECDKQGYYRLGPGIGELAEGLRDKPGIADLARPVMQSLQKATGETVILNARRGYRVVPIERVESNQEFRVSGYQGSEMYLHAGAAAKVLMAYLDEKELEKAIQAGLPKITRTTLTDPQKLKEKLRQIREKGYCVSAGEVVAGTRGIAAPIKDGDGKLVAGLGLIGPAQRIAGAKTARYTKMVVKAAEEIGGRIQRIRGLL
jgi:DNA-binding IclR family transcriptional regulator